MRQCCQKQILGRIRLLRFDARALRAPEEIVAFLLELPAFDRISQALREPIAGQRMLGKIIGRTGLHEFDSGHFVALAGQDDDRRGQLVPVRASQHIEAIASGQFVIEQHTIECLALERSHRGRHGGYLLKVRRQSGGSQRTADRDTINLVIID